MFTHKILPHLSVYDSLQRLHFGILHKPRARIDLSPPELDVLTSLEGIADFFLLKEISFIIFKDHVSSNKSRE